MVRVPLKLPGDLGVRAAVFELPANGSARP